MDWREFYTAAYEKNFKKEYPIAYKDGLMPRPKFPKVSTSNGMQTMIKNFCLWSGHFANRINTQGQARVEKVKLAFGNTRTNTRWTPGTTRKGTADLDINFKHLHHKFGINAKVEVKVGRDEQRIEQEEYEQLVTATGAIYIIVRTPEDWFKFYYSHFPMSTLMV